MRNRNLTQKRLKERLQYNQSTGVFVWRSHRMRKSLIGTEAGSIDAKGYRVIYVDGVPYKAHRLAFLYVYGRWPVGRLDHRNRVCDDNRIQNLREATASENATNQLRRPANSSGFKGVDYHKASGKWRARVSKSRKVFCLGYHATPQDAAQAYDAKALELHGEFAVLNFPKALR